MNWVEYLKWELGIDQPPDIYTEEDNMQINPNHTEIYSEKKQETKKRKITLKSIYEFLHNPKK